MRDQPCEVHASEIRVRVTAKRYFYPDLAIVCGQPHFEDEFLDTLLNPNVIVEVLSPSTETFDRGKKFAAYRRLPSLQEYVLIAQDRPFVERYVRHGEEWVLTEYRNLADALTLTSVGCTVPLSEIYRKVELSYEEDDTDA